MGSWSSDRTLAHWEGWLLALVLLIIAGCTQGADNQEEGPTVEDRIAFSVQDALGSDPRFDRVRAVIATVDGETLFEGYYETSGEAYRPIQSVTKSVVATLVGIAVDQGLLSLDHTLADLLPSYRDRMRPRQAQLTLEQVLTMTAGFPAESPRDVFTIANAADPVTAALDLWTGRVGWYAYSNYGANLLSAILVEATGESVLDYARRELFEPLEIPNEPAHEPVARPAALDEYLAADFAWPVDRQGRHLTWAWLKLTPRDMVKLGELYLAGGRWDGAQVVSQEWVDAATGLQVVTPNGVLTGYGYQWWVGTLDNAPAAMAWGFAGQVVAVVPSQDLVMVVSGEIDFLGDPTGQLSPELVEVLLESAIMRHLDS